MRLLAQGDLMMMMNKNIGEVCQISKKAWAAISTVCLCLHQKQSQVL